MNATIQGIIDHMFKDTAVTAETRALHEELLNNCLEHYDDLIGRGMSETEAIDAVVDSLKGMKEVIDEYPKKKTAAAEEEKKQEIPVIETAPKAEAKKEEAPPEEKPSEYTFSADDVKKLKTELKNCDLKIGASGDGRIHVRCEDMEQLQCSLDNGVLYVRILDKAKKGNTGRYAAINLCPYHTIEFRLFRGTLKLNTLLATLQLVNRICDAALFMSEEEIARQSWRDFVMTVTEPELLQYLKERQLYVNDEVETEEDV